MDNGKTSYENYICGKCFLFVSLAQLWILKNKYPQHKLCYYGVDLNSTWNFQPVETYSHKHISYIEAVLRDALLP